MLLEDWREFQTGVSRLIAKSWIDEAFKQRFIADTAVVLSEVNITLPSNVEVRVNENSDRVSITNIGTSDRLLLEIPLPPKPDARTVADAEIESWADGGGTQPPCITPCV